MKFLFRSRSQNYFSVNCQRQLSSVYQEKVPKELCKCVLKCNHSILCNPIYYYMNILVQGRAKIAVIGKIKGCMLYQLFMLLYFKKIKKLPKWKHIISLNIALYFLGKSSLYRTNNFSTKWSNTRRIQSSHWIHHILSTPERAHLSER